MSMIRQAEQQGFTLVELVTTIVVGTLFILALNAATTSYVHTGQQIRDFSAANAYVESEAEYLRNASYNSLSIGSTDLTSNLPSELNKPRSATMTVTQPSTGLKKVDLSVTYNDQGQPRTLSYTTYVGELGVGQ